MPKIPRLLLPGRGGGEMLMASLQRSQNTQLPRGFTRAPKRIFFAPAL